jgi:hypothetical protein
LKILKYCARYQGVQKIKPNPYTRFPELERIDEIVIECRQHKFPILSCSIRDKAIETVKGQGLNIYNI